MESTDKISKGYYPINIWTKFGVLPSSGSEDDFLKISNFQLFAEVIITNLNITVYHLYTGNSYHGMGDNILHSQLVRNNRILRIKTIF